MFCIQSSSFDKKVERIQIIMGGERLGEHREMIELVRR